VRTIRKTTPSNAARSAGCIAARWSISLHPARLEERLVLDVLGAQDVPAEHGEPVAACRAGVVMNGCFWPVAAEDLIGTLTVRTSLVPA